MNGTVLDVRKLLCPLPVIRTQDAAATLQAGDSIRVVCTDPGVLHDIPAWCRVHGHEVCEIIECNEEIIILIRIGSGG
ncbi:MAG: sulfurtransferase TusA family protein [Gammaproteobacteria bacterium]